MNVTYRQVLAAIALVSTACASSKTTPSAARSAPSRTCVALSVGGPAGVAHLGALEALWRAGIRPTCVAGNSIGAIIGSMYAVAPDANTTKMFREFVGLYIAASKEDAKDNAGTGILVGVLLGAVTGGAGWIVLAGASGGIVGFARTDAVDYDRMVVALDAFYEHARIQDLKVSYRTAHQKIVRPGVEMVDVRSGNLARAAMMSAANSLIFGDTFNEHERGYLDPGVDRRAATVVEDTCRWFPDSRIIAINVTGKAAQYDSKLQCPVIEVRVALPEVSAEQVFSLGDDFEAAWSAGFDATARALEQRGFYETPRRRPHTARMVRMRVDEFNARREAGRH